MPGAVNVMPAGLGGVLAKRASREVKMEVRANKFFIIRYYWRSRLDFSVKIVLSILSDFLWPEKLTQKKLSNFAKFLFFYDRIVQSTNFAKLPSGQCLFFL